MDSWLTTVESAGLLAGLAGGNELEMRGVFDRPRRSKTAKTASYVRRIGMNGETSPS